MTVQKVIIFRLKDELYGVPVEQVVSIERWESVTRVPNAPSFIKGIINLRGEILPVIDLQQRFGLGVSEQTEESRLVIAQIEEIKLGLIVDEAKDVIDLDSDSVDPSPETASGKTGTYIFGVAKQEDHLLILLNMEKVLRDDHLEAINQIEV
jgi:purine-binding chemotaxis protein CheW